MCFEMAAGLAARGHEIGVLTSDYGGRSAEYPGQRITRGWKLATGRNAIYEPFAGSAEERQAIQRANIACLREEVRAFAPDILFVWNLFFLDASLLRALEEQGRPTVYLLTDNWLITFLNPGFWHAYFADEVLGGKRSWLHRLRRKLRRGARFHPRGSAIFASRFMESLYRDAGFHFSDSAVIHHGIAGDPPARTNSRERLCAPGELRLLIAGRLVEIKGVHTAIDALPRIVKSLPDHRVALTIVGDQSDRAYFQRLQEQIRRLGLDERVTIAQPVPEAGLPALFGEHDILLFPSLYEPFSLTLIHALRAGIPTVASDAGGNVEVVREGATGKLFRRGDPRALAQRVLELARDRRLRATVSAGARQAAADYTFARMVEQVERYLEARR
jgi:glycosyltransferase involved in cell wall biosynthesis